MKLFNDILKNDRGLLKTLVKENITCVQKKKKERNNLELIQIKKWN